VLAIKSSVGAQLNPATNVDFAIFGAATGDIPVAAWGLSGQTEDLFTAFNDTTNNTRMAGIKSDGRVYTPALKLSITGAQSGGTGLIVAAAVGADATNYSFGTSLRQADAADGWPTDGLLVVHRYTNRIRQLLFCDDGRMLWRTTTTAAGPTWGVWRGGSAGYGVLGLATSTTDDSGSAASAQTALAGLSITFTTTETRVVIVRARVPLADGTAGDRAQVRLKSGSTTLQTSGAIPIITGTVEYDAYILYVTSLAAGTYTWNLTRERNSGSGTVWMPASATSPAMFLIQDLGFLP
jgi:hypothetical protein